MYRYDRHKEKSLVTEFQKFPVNLQLKQSQYAKKYREDRANSK